MSMYTVYRGAHPYTYKWLCITLTVGVGDGVYVCVEGDHDIGLQRAKHQSLRWTVHTQDSVQTETKSYAPRFCELSSIYLAG